MIVDLGKGGKMEKKGQAAMEFLMTYGWAILAAVIAIGVLSYYGVFSPGKSLPDICTLNAPFGCVEFKVDATTGVTMILRNGGGEGLTISEVTVEGCTDYTTSTPVSDGSKVTIVLACAGLSTGSKFGGDVAVTYLGDGKIIPKVSTGNIRAGVQ